MDAISEFSYVVRTILGVYLDATTGFDLVRQSIEKAQESAIGLLRNTHPELANLDYLDSALYIYGTGFGFTPLFHQATQKEVKLRNSPSGTNYEFAGNMALVSVYQYWEDHYRGAISRLLKLDNLETPIMGDLKRLRNSIVHHQGIAKPEINKCEVIRWFKKGDRIVIDQDRFVEIVYHIEQMLEHYRADYTIGESVRGFHEEEG